MSAIIYKHEFRARLRSVLIWSLSVAAMVIFFQSIFPAFASQAAMMKDLMARFPPALMEAFGLGKVDLSTVLGFFGFVFVFVQLCLSIQSGNYGFGLVSVEENEMTADFLLTKPVSRLQVISSKLLAAFSSLLLTDLVIWIVSFISVLSFHGDRTYNTGGLLVLMLSIVVFQLFFLAVGLIISLLVKRVRSVTPYSLGLGFGAYVLAAFSGMLGDFKLEFLTPFKQLDPMYFVKHNGFDTPLVILNISVTVIALTVSYWLYLRRDIPAVS